MLRDAQNPPSPILHSVLCNGSHFNIKGKWGACCQVNTCPAGMCAAGTAGVGFHCPPSPHPRLSFNLCFIHLLSPSHTSPLSTQESPNSITSGQPWEAASAAQSPAERGILICNMSSVFFAGGIQLLAAAALAENRTQGEEGWLFCAWRKLK